MYDCSLLSSLADNSRAPLRSGSSLLFAHLYSMVLSTLCVSSAGHCAAFDPWLRSIFVFGGQREDKHLGDMFTYDICTNTVSVMYTDGTQTHTKAFGRKSVIDFDLKEIYRLVFARCLLLASLIVFLVSVVSSREVRRMKCRCWKRAPSTDTTLVPVYGFPPRRIVLQW